MRSNPIVDDVREARRKLAEKHQFDIRRIFADAKSREASSGHHLVSFAEHADQVCEEPPEYGEKKRDAE